MSGEDVVWVGNFGEAKEECEVEKEWQLKNLFVNVQWDGILSDK